MRLAAAMLLAAASANAQMRPEARAELVNSGISYRAEAGAGFGVFLGHYLRGALFVSRDLWHDSGYKPQTRVESQLRFLLDPQAEEKWALSLGGGVGYHERGYLMLLADVEGPRTLGVRPAFQLALGGGLRLGLVLRRAVPSRR